jgi:hypothetical protein
MNQLQEKASAQIFAALRGENAEAVTSERWKALFTELANGANAVDHDPLRNYIRSKTKSPAKQLKPEDAQEMDMQALMDQRLGHLRDKMSTQLFNVIDTNKDGKASRDEWDDVFARAASNKEAFALDGFREVLSLTSLRKPAVRFLAVFSGDAGSFNEGPKVGDVAPDFTLGLHDSSKKVRLNEYRNGKPLVLVFGNFT